MIEEIEFIQYRKLKDITFKFKPGINLISGTNGTCKSTLMHLIGNSYQALKRRDARYSDSSATIVLGKFIDRLNPKIETISRSDRGTYSNPAEGTAGTLFTVKYMDGSDISFRRHNSVEEKEKENFRFSIKPQYGRNKKDRLPLMPVVYLGLSRLVPYGELNNDVSTEQTQEQLPEHIHAAFAEQYAALTRMEIVDAQNQNIKGIKKRSDFATKVEGIDSNTISSGEDNISIILTALNCLRNVTEKVVEGEERDVEGVLLIDEFDATLHPLAQERLFNLIADYAERYRIQVFFTTHSFYIIKHAYQAKANILYLVDQLDCVSLMVDPSPGQIEMHLNGLQGSAIYQNVYIPVYTEDAEARFFLEQLLDYISKTLDTGFVAAKNLLHFVNASIGSDALKSLFTDLKVNQSSMRAICILDGDQKPDLRHHIIALPGGSPPDRVFSEFLRKLIDDATYKAFWLEVQIYGYSKATAAEVLSDFDAIATKIASAKSRGESTHGHQRQYSKDHFNKHKEFYDLVIKAWLNADVNQEAIKSFRDDLFKVFKKTAPFHSIDDRIWPKPGVVNAA